MKTFFASIALIIATLVIPATPAQAHPGHSYMGWTAASVAKHTNCQRFSARKPLKSFKSTGICWLNGKQRVNIMTYRTQKQQVGHVSLIATLRPKYYVAFGHGVIMVARNGNYAAALAGKKALGTAQVVRGADY
jgi:hypothetical protein